MTREEKIRETILGMREDLRDFDKEINRTGLLLTMGNLTEEAMTGTANRMDDSVNELRMAIRALRKAGRKEKGK